MDVADAVARSGGLISRAALLRTTSRLEVDRALAQGALLRVGQGRYASPAVDAAARLAHGMNGVLCLTSAALHHGWAVKHVPDKPHVSVPRKRNVAPRRRALVILHRNDLSPDDLSGGIATGRELTLLQCLRSLPDDEALCIADSALRAGELATLKRVVAQVRGAGRAKVLRTGRAASPDAANPFESCLRAIALTVPGLRVVPQLVISGPHVWARPDLVDRDLRIVVEAESFEFHADRVGFRKDVRRYTLLGADGWLVLRFTWEDVMLRPEYVRDVLVRVVDARAQASTAWPAAA